MIGDVMIVVAMLVVVMVVTMMMVVMAVVMRRMIVRIAGMVMRGILVRMRMQLRPHDPDAGRRSEESFRDLPLTCLKGGETGRVLAEKRAAVKARRAAEAAWAASNAPLLAVPRQRTANIHSGASGGSDRRCRSALRDSQRQGGL